MGVGFMVVLVKFWWVFLILFGCLIFCRYIDKKEASEKEEAKLKKQQEAIIGAIRGGQADQSNNHTKPTFKGEPELSNDSYILFLAKKYAIEKNDLLGKYVLYDSLYPSLDEALKMADGLEIEQRDLEERRRGDSELQAIADAKAQKADNKRLAIGSVVLLFIASICWFYYVYGNKEPTQYAYQPLVPKIEIEMRVEPSFDCSKANSPSEKLICSDNELATEDNELFKLYKKAKAKSNDPVAFKAESVDAWKAREGYCKDKDCLLEWYSRRKAYYQDILNT